MSSSNASDLAPRRVGFLLAIGIFFLSPIFAWFTLRSGYSPATRVVSFGWMTIVLIGSMLRPQADISSINSVPPISTVSRSASESANSSTNPVMSAAAKPATPAERAAALAKLRVERDKVEDNTWYFDKTSLAALGTNGFYVYLGQSSTDTPYMRMVICYSGSDWLFFNKVLVKADDQKFEWLVPNANRHANYGSVSEWLDVEVTPDKVPMLQAILTAKHVTLRLSGDQFRRDRDLSRRELQAFRNIFAAYHAMGASDF